MFLNPLNSTVMASAPLNLSAPEDYQVQTGFDSFKSSFKKIFGFKMNYLENFQKLFPCVI